jgi:hypothetical protein
MSELNKRLKKVLSKTSNKFIGFGNEEAIRSSRVISNKNSNKFRKINRTFIQTPFVPDKNISKSMKVTNLLVKQEKEKEREYVSKQTETFITSVDRFEGVKNIKAESSRLKRAKLTSRPISGPSISNIDLNFTIKSNTTSKSLNPKFNQNTPVKKREYSIMNDKMNPFYKTNLYTNDAVFARDRLIQSAKNKRISFANLSNDRLFEFLKMISRQTHDIKNMTSNNAKITVNKVRSLKYEIQQNSDRKNKILSCLKRIQHDNDEYLNNYTLILKINSSKRVTIDF